MPLTNPWVSYIDRTYQQIKDSVLTKLNALAPEITDHTESNPLIRMLGIWAGLIEMLGYYLDNAARETHLSTARLYRSGVKIANAYDYRIHAHVPSTGDVTFILSAVAGVNVTVPEGTEVQNADGIKYFTVEDLIIVAGQIEGTVSVEQAEIPIAPVIGTSDGTSNQVFVVEGNIVDGSMALTVNALAWQSQETLAYSYPTDTHYVQSVNEDQKVIVKFGDDVAGAIPPNGQTIAGTYKVTLGEDGNTGAFTITNIISSIVLPIGVSITCENRIRTSGGRGVETLEELQRRVPKSNRVNLREVTRQDFIDFPEMVAGVAKAGIIFDCGKGVDVYIIPDGGGVASGLLISQTDAYMDIYRLLLVNINVFAAGEVNISLIIDIDVLPQYSKASTITLVRSNLTTFLSFLNQEITGVVHLSDIYQIIENTLGVSTSNVLSMKAVPFARILTGTNTLNWTRETADDNSSSQVWTIKIVGVSTYELLRGTSFLGVFNIGDVISLTEITFTVLASSYSIGDSWEFYTYPSLVAVNFGKIDILEPSLPISLDSDISISATGGI